MTARESPSPRRPRRSFWILVVVAILAAGSLSSAIPARPSPLTGLRVGASGLVLVASVLLAARVYAAIDRATGIARDASSPNAPPSRTHPKGSPR